MKVRRVSQEGIDLIKKWEGFRETPYYCAAGFRTVGFGHVILPWEDLFHVTEEEAEEILRKDVRIAERSVCRLIKTRLYDGEYAALCSFCFNLGGGALQRSTLRAMVNRGEYSDAAEEFPKWIWAGGRKLRGLLLRRLEEQELFLSRG